MYLTFIVLIMTRKRENKLLRLIQMERTRGMLMTWGTKRKVMRVRSRTMCLITWGQLMIKCRKTGTISIILWLRRDSFHHQRSVMQSILETLMKMIIILCRMIWRALTKKFMVWLMGLQGLIKIWIRICKVWLRTQGFQAEFLGVDNLNLIILDSRD